MFDIKTTRRKFNANDISFGGRYPYVVRTSVNNGIRGFINEDTSFLNAGNTISFGQDTATIFYQENPYFTGDKIKILNCKFFLNRKIACYLIACMRKSFSGFSWGVTSFNENRLKEICIVLPVLRNGEIDFHYMEARIRELEEARIRELETYLKVAGFENCELTEEEQCATNQMQLGQVKFKSFFVTDDKHRTDGVFKVNNSHNILQNSIVAGSGNTPYVTAGEGNNSVYAYISYDKSQIEEGNAIMIGGKTMVVTYQAEDFFSNDSHNLVLYAKDSRLRKELIQLFMVASLKKSLKPLYSWGDSISKTKIKKDIFYLPVTSNDEIDYHFMETYIRAQEKLAIQRVKDWRTKEIDTTKNIVKADTETGKAKDKMNYEEWQSQNDVSMMVAEDIFINGSLEVRLHETKRDDLLDGKLDLVLMYAISPTARRKTESAGKIALGIKESNLSYDAVKAYESVKYIMFHYWKNSDAKMFRLTTPTRLVAKGNVPNDYLLRQEKDARQFLLLEYEQDSDTELGEYDIMRVQRKGTDRYIPFVCKVEDVE